MARFLATRPTPPRARREAEQDHSRTRRSRAGKPTGNAGLENGRTFRAELDVSELDDRGRPGLPWTARGIELNRSGMIFRSRRMCYEDRYLILCVHLVDDEPVPLYGKVVWSEYDADGQHRTKIQFAELPESELLKAWVLDQRPRGRMW